MVRESFAPQAALPIVGAFDRPRIIVPGDMAERLVFDPDRLGSQFYPGIGKERIGGFLNRAVKMAAHALSLMPAAERAALGSFAVTLNAGRAIGFDALVPAPEGGAPESELELDKLSPWYASPFAPTIAGVLLAPDREDDAYDPFLNYLIARYVVALFTVEKRENGEPLSFKMDDVTVTSRRADAFVSKPDEQAPTGALWLLGTPAQRQMLLDLLKPAKTPGSPKYAFTPRPQPHSQRILSRMRRPSPDGEK